MPSKYLLPTLCDPILETYLITCRPIVAPSKYLLPSLSDTILETYLKTRWPIVGPSEYLLPLLLSPILKRSKNWTYLYPLIDRFPYKSLPYLKATKKHVSFISPRIKIIMYSLSTLTLKPISPTNHRLTNTKIWIYCYTI